MSDGVHTLIDCQTIVLGLPAISGL